MTKYCTSVHPIEKRQLFYRAMGCLIFDIGQLFYARIGFCREDDSAEDTQSYSDGGESGMSYQEIARKLVMDYNLENLFERK